MPVTEQDALRAMEAFKVLGDQPELQAKAKLISDTYRTEQDQAGKPLFPEYQRQSAQEFQKIRNGVTDSEKYGFDDDTFRDFAQTFPDPEKRARYVNNQFLSRTFQRSTDDIRNGGASYRDEYSKATWGEPAKSDEDFRQKLAADFETEDSVADYAQTSALKGLSPQEAIATLPDEIRNSDSFKKQEANFSKVFTETAEATDSRIAPYRDTITRTVADLQATMGVDDATGVSANFSEFAQRLIEIPREDLNLVLSAIVANAGEGENKGFAKKLAENFSRGARDMALDIPAFADRASLMQMSGFVNQGAGIVGDASTVQGYLKGLNERIVAASDPTGAAGIARGLENIGAETVQPSGEIKAQAVELIETQMDALDLANDIREIADNDIDPAKGEYMVTRGLYAAARSIPYTLVAMAPGGAIATSAALAEQSYQTLRRANPDMNRNDAMMISTVAGPIMGALEKVSAGILTGKLPTLGRFMNQAVATKGGAAARFAVRGVESTGLEMVQENLQDFTPFAVQGAVAALTEDIPAIPWNQVYGGDFWGQQGELFFAVLPLALFGAGAGTVSDFKGARELISNPQAVSTLIGDTAKAVEIADLGKAGKFDQAQTLLREELRNAGQDTKEIQAVRNEAANNLQREAIAQKAAIEKGEDAGIIPIVSPSKDGYLVRFNDKTERVFPTYTEANEARWAHAGSQNIRFHEDVVATINHADRTQREGQGTRYVFSGQSETLLTKVQKGEVSQEAALNRADTAGDVDNQVTVDEEIKAGIADEYGQNYTAAEIKSLNEDDRLNALTILGENVTEFENGLYITTAKLHNGATWATVIEEKLEGDVAVMLKKDRREWLIGSLRAFEQSSGDRIFRADSEGQETDTDIKEAYARAGLAYFIGTADEKGGFQTSKKFRKQYKAWYEAGLSGSMEGYARFFASVAQRADSLQQMRKKGALDPDLERELARSTGYGEQAQYADSVIEEVKGHVEELKASGFVESEGESNIDDAPFSTLSNIDQKAAELFTPYLRDPEQRFSIVQEVQKRAVEKAREWQPIINANRPNKEIEAERKIREADLIGDKLDTLSPAELGALEAQGALDDVGMRPILSDLLREKYYKTKSGKSVRYWRGSLMSKSAAKREGTNTKGGEWDDMPEGLPPYVWGGTLTPDRAAAQFGFETVDEFWTALSAEVSAFQNLKEDTKQAMSRIRELEKEAKAESRAWADEQMRLRQTVGNDRATLIGAMRTLDAMISALPVEIRGKIGGFTQLAKYTTPQALFNELERRTKTLDRELERWLKKEADKGVRKLFEKAKPASDKAGKKRVGKAGADIHDLFDTARQAWKNWTSEKAEEYATGLEATIAKGELSGKAEAYAEMEAELVRSFGGWNEADSVRRTHALKTATDLWAGGFLEHQQKKAELRERNDGIRKDLMGDTGKTGALSERNLAEEAGLKFGAKSKEFMLGLLNFDQLVSITFGKKSKWAEWFADNQRNAENKKLDAVQEVTEGVEDLFTRLAGGSRFEGEKLQYKLSRKSITAKSATGDNVKLSELEGLTALLMWQQEDGKRHMRGRKDEEGNLSSTWSYDDGFVDEISGKLSSEAWEILGYLQGEYGKEYEPLNAVYRELYGINLPKNPNYSPLTMAPQQASGGQSVDPVTGTTASNGSMTPGGLRTRGAGAIAEPQFRDAVATFIAHRKQMEHWKAHAEFNRDAQAILGNREVGNSVEAKHGKEAVTIIRKWLDAIAQGGVRDVAAGTRMNAGIAKMMGNAAGMALVGRAGTIAVQATQLGAAAAKMPVGAYVKRLGKLLSGNLGWGEAMNSPYIQRRIAQQPVIVQAAMEGLRAGKPTQIKHQVRKLGNLIGGADALFTAGTFAMVYDYQFSQAVKNGATTAEAAEIAGQEAERITDEIAQPTRLGARSYVEVSMTNPFAKMSWAFGSESRKNLALLGYNMATGSTAEKAQAILYVVAINGLLSGVIRNVWRDARGDDDDEIFDEKYWSAKRLGLITATDWLFGFPVVGEQIQNAIFSAFGEYQYDSSLLDPIGKAPASLKNLATGESGDVLRDVENIMTAIGLFEDNTAAAVSLMHIVRDVYGLGKNFID